MQRLIRIGLFGGALFLGGCYDTLFVMQQERGKESLPSSQVHTPDPRQEKAHTELIVGWQFPRSVMKEDPFLRLRVRFWDQQEEEIIQLLAKPFDVKSFSFPERQVLTYLVQILSKEETEIACWEHQFWTEKIEVKCDRRKETSSQPKQESVIETP